MRMSDAEYFRSCVAKERHLAHLLGHLHLEEFVESAGTLWEENHALPKWTRDWKACAPLLVEYELTPVFLKQDEQAAAHAVQIDDVVVQFADHPSRDRAVMYAIVKAVISRLEHHKPHRH